MDQCEVGAYMCCIISIAASLPHWNIQYSAASYSAIIGGYALFLDPMRT